jgi:hypothetical protein
MNTLTLKTVALAAAISASSLAMAAENGEQRYAPGMGGSDMSTPIQPGWYGQTAMVAYHASKLKGNDGGDNYKTATVPSTSLGGLASFFPNGVPVKFKTNLSVDIVTILPRITYISSEKVLGGNLGFTAMLPLMREKDKLSASGASVPSTFIPTAATILGGGTATSTTIAQATGIASTLQGQVSAGVANESGAQTGIGDLELAPIIHWEIGDHQSAGVAATVIIPTGDYDANRLVNTGFGNYYTFRPSFQYAYIGDGWDVAGRLVLSFNMRNKDTQYKTGNIMNLDFAAMKFVSDDVRVGLQGYVVHQLTGDSQEAGSAHPTFDDLTNGNKMQVYAAGPAVAWLKNGGEFLLEGKFLQEFGAKNRTEGQTFWLTLSKPL